MVNTNKFRNAYGNLENGKTISGLVDGLGADGGYYIDRFYQTLIASIGTNGEDCQKLLTDMNEYLSVFEFDGDEVDQDAMVAAFGLILYDRLTRGILENIPYSEFFTLHFEMEHCCGLLWQEDNFKGHRTALAKKAVQQKLAKDPKQKDKALVRECWDEWQKQATRYKGKASFARDMREKFPGLESQPVIERWCREWEGQNVTQQAQ